jgi:hypothetical protein
MHVFNLSPLLSRLFLLLFFPPFFRCQINVKSNLVAGLEKTLKAHATGQRVAELTLKLELTTKV